MVSAHGVSEHCHAGTDFIMKYSNELKFTIQSTFRCIQKLFISLTFQMLLNLHKKSWIDGLTLEDYGTHCSVNEKCVKEMLELAKNYNKVSANFIL